jgi:hypothetical protein
MSRNLGIGLFREDGSDKVHGRARYMPDGRMQVGEHFLDRSGLPDPMSALHPER